MPVSNPKQTDSIDTTTTRTRRTRARSLTERLVVLMTPKLKKQLARKAAAAKTSVGDLIRQAVTAYDPIGAGEEVMMRELLAAIRQRSAEAMRALDEAEAEVRQTRAYFNASRSA